MELKPLPSHLRYKYLGPNHTFPVIFSTKLDDSQIQKLLDILRKHNGAIGYIINDIGKMNPLLYMHTIHLDKGHKPSKQPQRRLNLTCKKWSNKRLSSHLMLGSSSSSPIANRLARCK